MGDIDLLVVLVKKVLSMMFSLLEMTHKTIIFDDEVHNVQSKKEILTYIKIRLQLLH